MHKPGLFGMNGFMVFLLTCLSVTAHGQQAGFLILIDAENKQSFTMRIGEQFYSSSAQGHLVLPQLKDSSYQLDLRFPKSGLPELSFHVVLRHKDQGFQLKGADSSWVLYNWQTKESIRSAVDHDSSRVLVRGIKRDDGFSRLMAAVVADSSVMYNTYSESGFNRDTSNVKSVPVAADSQKLAINKKEAIAISKKPVADSLIASGKKQPILTGSSVSPGIKKLREVSLKISRKIVYQEIGKDGIKDTITLFVFFEKQTDSLKKQATTPAVVLTKPVKTIDTGNLNKTSPRNKTVTKPGESGCSQVASDDDVAFLRSAILKANSEDEKIGVASEAFSIKCFTVSQVRLLASLFVSDKDKYKLMDAARQHVSDREHFRELVDMLTDKNFQRKFLVMADKKT